jgi:hypothetical protein
MDPALADGETIAADGLEVAGHWGHRRRVEMRTGSHSPAPFLELLAQCRRSQLAGSLELLAQCRRSQLAGFWRIFAPI